jgi:hypothetical protein
VANLVVALLVWLVIVAPVQLALRRSLRQSRASGRRDDLLAVLLSAAWAAGPILLVTVGGLHGPVWWIAVATFLLFASNYWFSRRNLSRWQEKSRGRDVDELGPPR